MPFFPATATRADLTNKLHLATIAFYRNLHGGLIQDLLPGAPLWVFPYVERA
jgi:hypothetical protein